MRSTRAIQKEQQNNKPVTVTEGAGFQHDGFAVASGWKVAPEQYGGTTIKRMKVTLKDDQGIGGRSALLTFRLYKRVHCAHGDPVHQQRNAEGRDVARGLHLDGHQEDRSVRRDQGL